MHRSSLITAGLSLIALFSVSVQRVDETIAGSEWLRKLQADAQSALAGLPFGMARDRRQPETSATGKVPALGLLLTQAPSNAPVSPGSQDTQAAVFGPVPLAAATVPPVFIEASVPIASADVPALAGTAVSPNLPAFNDDEFRNLAKTVLAGLPTRAELRAQVVGRAHSTSPQVIRAGSLLGQVAQALHDNPQLSDLGTEFYVRCASSDEFLTSVRALCYARLLSREPSSSIEVPKQVLFLAQQSRR